MDSFLNLRKQARRDFYEAQFNYYKKFNTAVIIIAVLASLTYFISDCQLFGRLAEETIIPRFSILAVLVLYLFITKKTDNFYIHMIASETVGHAIMWCTIWAIWYLPNRQYASDGFLIMQIVMLMIGFAATFEIAVLSQVLIIGNILISHTFNHYVDLDLMVSLGLPCVIGISIANYVFTQSYYETYRVKAKLESLSYIDQLTGVYNRHKLDEITTDNRLNHARLQDVSLILLDIDFFKKINDTFGHDKGDIVLKELANILKNNVRNDDVVIRWGGEEFLIILYDCNERNAIRVAENIREKVSEHNNGIQKITISLGVCEYNGSNYKESVHKADEALYKAKQTGRNRTVSYSNIGLIK